NQPGEPLAMRLAVAPHQQRRADLEHHAGAGGGIGKVGEALDRHGERGLAESMPGAKGRWSETGIGSEAGGLNLYHAKTRRREGVALAAQPLSDFGLPGLRLVFIWITASPWTKPLGVLA